jgi:hypothetical protein
MWRDGYPHQILPGQTPQFKLAEARQRKLLGKTLILVEW